MTTISEALNTLSIGLAELAEALKGGDGLPPLRAIDEPAAVATPAAAAPATKPEGHLEVCPKHHKPFTPGTYGPYCKEFTDDPAWAKVKPDGKMFCNITPANAAEYLRFKAAADPVPF